MIRLTGANVRPGRHIAEKFTTADIPHVSTDIDLDITDESDNYVGTKCNLFKGFA